MPHVARWSPPVALARQEQFLMKRLGRVRKLLGFLRQHRHELFDDAFQSELASMYRKTGAGRDPVTPALMAMATLVRFIGSDMDRRLLERTVQLARETKEFDAAKLPKALRVALDSAPLEGAGRVEDTVNLLGHAGRKVARCAAEILSGNYDRVCIAADSPVLLGSSIKRALDVDWNDATEKRDALNELCHHSAICPHGSKRRCRWSWRTAAEGARRDAREDPRAGP